MNELLNKIKETIETQQLLVPGDRVLIALSGGADSVCLFKALQKLQKQWQITLVAAHVHHGLRGKDADADEAFVRKLCAESNVPLFVKHADVALMAKEAGVGIEDMGRRVRYAFFEEILRKENLNKIATAHHAGDNVETVLMRLMRGTGPLGLGGIPYQNGAVIRPLLKATRAEIETFLHEEGLQWQTDSTNEETVFTRNRIRHQLIPLIEREYNPNFQQRFTEQIELYAACGAYIKNETKDLFNRVAMPVTGGYSFCCKELQSVSPFLVQTLLYDVISSLQEEPEVGMAAVKSAYQLLNKSQGKADLGRRITAQICHGKLYIQKERMQHSFEYIIEPQGAVFIPEAEQTVSFEETIGVSQEKSGKVVFLNPEALQGKKLYFRSRKEGDYFYPSGMGGRQKLKDFFINNKVPAFMRDAVPILTADDDVVWVVGYRADERYLAKSNQKKTLRLSLESTKLN